MAKFITILRVFKFRRMVKGLPRKESFTAAEFEALGLYLFGGCAGCGESLAAYNAYPSTGGYWCCKGCIDDYGFATVREFEAWCAHEKLLESFWTKVGNTYTPHDSATAAKTAYDVRRATGGDCVLGHGSYIIMYGGIELPDMHCDKDAHEMFERCLKVEAGEDPFAASFADRGLPDYCE